MGCCGQNTTGAGAGAVDTGKRVNYTQGMLLGVDDFVQDQAWHAARRHELAREVLGYGTVRGLQVAIEPGVPRVHVTPGMAWMPSGTPVCVPGEQCAGLNDWLKAHWTDEGVGDVVAAAPQPAPLSLYVVLAYDTCLTDKVPVPGEPCRSEEDLTADSRIADCFRLELRTRAPDQVEEDAIRDFADWLAQVPVDTQSPPLSEEAFLAQLRDAAQLWLAPSSPHVGDFMFGSPPAGFESTDALIRAALRLWATELRPRWRARYGCGPGAAAPGGPDDAVLLAELRLRVYAATREAEAAVEVVQDRRPVLMSLRLLQELLTQNPAPEAATTVVAAQAFGLSPAVGVDAAYARADHSHGTPSLPLLAGDATGPVEANQVVALQGTPVAADAPAPGDVLQLAEVENPEGGTRRVWTPTALQLPQPAEALPSAIAFPAPGAAGTAADYARADHVHPFETALDVDGDVGGTHTATTVQRLQGVPLDARKPEPGQVLTLVEIETEDGVQATWVPRPAAGGAAAGDALPRPVVAGSSGAAGSAAAFARADHEHPFALPPLAGDVTGGAGENTVTRLRGRDLDSAPPQAGDTLLFTGRAWAARQGVTPVVAGKLRVELKGGKLVGNPGATVLRPFGKVRVVQAGVAGSAVCVRLLAEAALPGPEKAAYLLKLTPTLAPEWSRFIFSNGDTGTSMAPFPPLMAFGAGDPGPDDNGKGIRFDIVLTTLVDLQRLDTASLEVQFEIGRYVA